MEKFKITKKNVRPFTDKETGQPVPWAWYKAIRLADKVAVDLGANEIGYEVGDEIEAAVEKRETSRGGSYYKVLAPKA